MESIIIMLYNWFTVAHFQKNKKTCDWDMVIEDVSFFNEKHTFSEGSNKEYPVRT
jgi:hypothetical protein